MYFNRIRTKAVSTKNLKNIICSSTRPSEDKLMLRLMKLHRNGNRTSLATEFIGNVKQMFLNGISADVKRNIFIFCNSPHWTTVTIHQLLESVQKVTIHETCQNVHIILLMLLMQLMLHAFFVNNWRTAWNTGKSTSKRFEALIAVLEGNVILYGFVSSKDIQ